MGQRGVLRDMGEGLVGFWCPGCKEVHIVNTEVSDRPNAPAWDFNGDYEAPTFSPSILVRGHKLVRDEAGKWLGEWERDAAGNIIPLICHSFVRSGNIEFLGDCSHELAGQTVRLEARENQP